jgi:amino acid transporter
MSANDYEKNQYAADGGDIILPSNDHDIKGIVNTKGGHIGEAADIYGSVEQAEQYGYVKRS